MRLKSLEIKGFKSFADKTLIHFPESVIGIVGSNGCGKSNIIDAIRWVLGEQKTSQLRSEAMTGVIFNGTQERKPAALADVCLSFENHRGLLPLAYQEVSIRRQLYQDGSSEYRLNEVKCRLKDIQLLLADTGIGSDSYAIIALGMVDELLQDRDNARMKLFEQAAGISKYKVRKKETLSKLKATEEDLTRTDDLVSELEKNLRSLERQAKKAEKYFALKQEYQEKALLWHTSRIHKLKNEYKILQEQINQEQTRSQQLAQEEQELNLSLSKHKQKLEQAAQEHQNQIQAWNQAKAQVKNLEHELALLEQNLGFKNKQLEQSQAQAQQAQHLSLSLKQTWQENRDTLDLALEQLAEEQAKDLHLKNDFQWIEQTRSNRQNAAKTAQEDCENLNRQLFKLEQEYERNQEQIQNLEKQSQDNRQLETKLLEKLQQTQDQLNLSQEQSQEQQKQLEALRQAENQRLENVQNLENQIRKLKQDLGQEQIELNKNQKAQDALAKQISSLSGYSEAVRYLAKQQGLWPSAPPPLLADLFDCPPQLRPSLGLYLETYLECFVVQTSQEAWLAWPSLQQANKGQASFIVLDALPPLPPPNQNQGLGQTVLSQIQIKNPKQYLKLFQFLLGNLRWIQTPKPQEELPLDNWDYLDQQGQFYRQQQILKLGPLPTWQGQNIGRENDLQKLHNLIKQNQENLHNLNQTNQELNLQLQNLIQNDQRKTIQNLEKQWSLNQGQNSSLQAQIQELQKQYLQNQTLNQTLKQQIQTLQNHSQTLAQNIENQTLAWEQSEKLSLERLKLAQQAEQEYQFQVQQQQNQSLALLRAQNQVQNLEQKQQFLQNNLQEQEKQSQTNLKLSQELQTQIQTEQLKYQELQTQIQQAKTHSQQTQNLSQLSENQFIQARKTSDQTQENLQLCQKQQQQQLALLRTLEQNFSEIKIQLNGIAERLQAEFECNINELINLPKPPQIDPELENQVASLRKELQNFGPINPTALQAFEELQERLNFILQEKNDLVQAQQALLDTIKEIETRATEQFLQAFEQVRLHFIQVFRSLFLEDDTCDLLLSNPEQALESNIEIIAKPKGKRPLSIQQLSGGEKTLTATALLFALYLLKPAPFCIFDEVDAPLDDANIAKFNRIIKDFSHNSQFIIVTHNKRTMQAVQIMYGVTMVKGISKLVPVDFSHLSEFPT